MPFNIVRGAKASRKKAQLARDLRQQMTPAEQVLWQALRRNQLDGLHFRRQQVIGGFIADFYCHAAGLIVEVDGPIHSDTVAYDAQRDEAIARFGLRVLRLTNDEVLRDLRPVMRRIAAAVNASRPQASSPSLATQGAVAQSADGSHPPRRKLPFPR